MVNRNLLDRSVLLELAGSLTLLQRQIVLSLRDRGPGLLLEVAVRVLKFPEEVSQPVADLREKRVVEFSKVSGGAFGGDMISLTASGEQLASHLRDEVFLQQLEQPAQASRAWDPHEQEVILLQRLGDVAVQDGNLAAASKYYEQALKATRSLSTPAP